MSSDPFASDGEDFSPDDDDDDDNDGNKTEEEEGDVPTALFQSPKAGTQETSLETTTAAFSRLSVGGSPRMVFLAAGSSIPCATIQTFWKDGPSGQNRVTVAVNMASGAVPADMSAKILDGTSEIQIVEKRPRGFNDVASLLPFALRQKLYESGHGEQPDRNNEQGYPFHTLGIAQGLATCLDKQKAKPDFSGDTRPVSTFVLEIPCMMDSVFCSPNGHPVNEYQLYGVEGDKITNKQRGLWHQVLMMECLTEKNTFRQPCGPDCFEPVRRANKGWATATDIKAPSNGLNDMDVEDGGLRSGAKESAQGKRARAVDKETQDLLRRATDRGTIEVVRQLQQDKEAAEKLHEEAQDYIEQLEAELEDMRNENQENSDWKEKGKKYKKALKPLLDIVSVFIRASDEAKLAMEAGLHGSAADVEHLLQTCIKTMDHARMLMDQAEPVVSAILSAAASA
jgi:hypothetical protein